MMLSPKLKQTVCFVALMGLATLVCVPSVLAKPDTGAPVAAKEAPSPAQKQADGEGDTENPALEATLEQRFEIPRPFGKQAGDQAGKQAGEQQARVGQRLELELDVVHPTGASVHLPDSFGNPRWELVDTRRETLAAAEGSQQTKLALIFQIFRPGSTTLPSFVVTVMQSDGKTAQLRTEPIEAKVVSVLPGDKTPKPEPHQSPVAVWTDDYTPAWAGGILLTALLAGGLAFLLGRRREDDGTGEPLRPAHVVALEKLSALTTDDLLDRGEFMLYYVRMSGAVREYLGRRYGFRGTELTTTEILDHLERVEWPSGLSLEDVREWLLHCDLIKFSGMIPARERAEQTLRRGFSIVELTREHPELESESEPDTEPEPDTGAEPEPGAEPDTDTDTDPEPDTKPDTDTAPTSQGGES